MRTPSAASDLAPNKTYTPLRFVTGKGGVGKTTVAAGLAELAVSQGQRVLAVDAGGTGNLRRLLDSRRDGQAKAKGLTVETLTTQSALDEYVKLYLKVPIAPSNLGPIAKVFDFVSQVAPGVKEILTVGKIGHEVVNGPWDMVIVDAPATGHVVELLAAPESLAKIAPGGPLAEQTSWLAAVLEADTTDIVVVSLAEELPVAETQVLVRRITEESAVSIAAVVANRLRPNVDTKGRAEAATARSKGSPLGPLATLLSEVNDQTQQKLGELSDLAGSIDVPLLSLPESIDPVASACSVFADSGRL